MKRIRFSDMIVHEDEQYLVINKPPGVSTLSDRSGDPCIQDRARKYYPEIQVCHRLDKHTSGLLVLAKNQQAYRDLALQFQNRAVTKHYHAVVQGRHQFNQETVDLPLTMSRRGAARVDDKLGKPAETVVHTLDIYKAHTLLECRPITGRTHQIRVHLSHLGAPLVGDLTYGGQNFFLSHIKPNYNLKRDTQELPLMSRPALHAISLEFRLKDESARFEAPYPKDFRVLIRQLEKNRPVASI